jgi:hypothetical protein
VFVRRVAIRIFNLLKQYSWEYLRASEFISLNQHTELKAILNPKGQLIKVALFASSGNTTFDRIVEKSTKEGVTDPNPPPSAVASDGTIPPEGRQIVIPNKLLQSFAFQEIKQI